MEKTTAFETLKSSVLKPVEPLPGQRILFADDEAKRQAELFDAGHDLPGAAERDQQIIWDLLPS